MSIAHFTFTRTRLVLVLAITVLAALAVVALPSSAGALSDSDSPGNGNFTLTKESSTDDPVQAGDTIDYTLTLDSNWDGFPTTVTITDTLGPGLIYDSGSAAATRTDPGADIVAFDNFAVGNQGSTTGPNGALSFGGGSGYTGNWTATAGAGEANIFRNIIGGSTQAMRFHGDADGANNGVLSRTVTTTNAVSGEVEYGLAIFDPPPAGITGNFRVTVSNGTDTLVQDHDVSTLPVYSSSYTNFSIDVSSLLPAASLTVSYQVTSGVDGGSETAPNDQVLLDYADVNLETEIVTDWTSYLSLPASASDPQVIELNAPSSSIDEDTEIVVTYSATVASKLEGYQTTITNSASGGLLNPTAVTVDLTHDLDRNPVLAYTVSVNTPIHVGSNLVLTATVSHAPSSDGAAVCDFEFASDTPTYGFTYLSGDTNTDGCLDEGETWVLSQSLAGMTGTAGTFSVPVGAFGNFVDDQEYEGVSAFEYTVVLADSGADDQTGLLLNASGLVVLGAGLILLARRFRQS
jgi:uncharacterized repeat protein (TIGR01451 family)